MDRLVKLVEKWSGMEGLKRGKDIDFIDGFPNHVITTDGRIIVLSYEDLNGSVRKTKEVKQRLNNDGYPSVRITHRGNIRNTGVHRLVAETFIPNPENRETVNHIDGDKTNNHVSNLEWATRGEQMQHAYKLGLKKPNAVMKLMTKVANSKPVKCVKKETNETMYFLSARDCSREMGYSERWCDKIIGTQDGKTRKFDLSYVTMDELKENTDKVTMETLIRLVEWWSYERGLHTADPTKQLLKTFEEASEIGEALTKDKPEELKDGIGDTVVTLIILCQQLDIELSDCVNAAYNEIKDRKGKLVDGTVIKITK